MSDEYLAFKSLMEDTRYKALEDLWIYHLSKIEEARDRAAKRGQESSWRYYAGQEAGFKRATMALRMAIADIEKKDDNVTNEEKVLSMLEELKIKQQPTGDTPQ